MYEFLKRYEKNKNGRDFVVGDIHGEFFLLERKLRELGFDKKRDRLFSVGDNIDRGPRSDEAVDYLMKEPWFFSVKGNHEQMLIDSVKGLKNAQGNHFCNGGAWFYGISSIEQQCIASLFDDLPIAIEVETDKGLVGIIHAEVPWDDWAVFKELYPQRQETFDAIALWKRTRIDYKKEHFVENISAVYSGHSYVENYTVLGNVHCLDTGACFEDGYMTIVQIQ